VHSSVNQATQCDLGRLNKWMQGRSPPRAASVYAGSRRRHRRVQSRTLGRRLQRRRVRRGAHRPNRRWTPALLPYRTASRGTAIRSCRTVRRCREASQSFSSRRLAAFVRQGWESDRDLYRFAFWAQRAPDSQGVDRRSLSSSSMFPRPTASIHSRASSWVQARTTRRPRIRRHSPACSTASIRM
jgi:hypothetical protein